jgi:uncharacterized protein YutE (UPF0331/DUF86 family)
VGRLDKTVIQRRLIRLDRLLKGLGKYTGLTYEVYAQDEDVQSIIERRLQVLAQICLDIANYLVARLGLEVPDEEENVFTMLAKAGLLSHPLAGQMKGLVGFRNILVHDYLEIDQEIVFENFAKNMRDFRDFAAEITDYLDTISD